MPKRTDLLIGVPKQNAGVRKKPNSSYGPDKKNDFAPLEQSSHVGPGSYQYAGGRKPTRGRYLSSHNSLY